MKRFVSAFVLLCFCLLSAGAQVKFNVSYKKVSPTELDIVFTGTIEQGWHVYASDIEPGGPNPTTFCVDEIKGAKLKGPLKDGGGKKTEYDDMFDMNVGVFFGSCVFTQRVELLESQYSIVGYLDYQACQGGECRMQKYEFSHVGKDGPSASQKKEEPAVAPADPVEVAGKEPVQNVEEGTDVPENSASADTVSSDTVPVVSSGNETGSLWEPVLDELKAFDGTSFSDMSLWMIFLLGFLGGLVALCTPCVWPIIPMTVSFFLKRNKDSHKGVREAILYGCSIVVIYVTLGLLVTSIFGASALNSLSTSAVFNIFFFLLLLLFAASFFGGFEITLPSSWGSAVDSKAEKTTGLLSIFLMAFTLSLVSFSCTGPIIGFLLVEVSTSGGATIAPAIGMFGFALALALPFTLFALFPTWLKSVPKSGGWLNVVKVTLGFLELAFALKFLSVADLAYGWHLLDRETFLALWIVIFALLGFYLLGKIKFPHDDPDDNHVSVPRFFLALASLSFAVYMVPGLWGAPFKAVSAFAPPMNTQDFNLHAIKVEAKFKDYEEGMAYARQAGKPVILDFTGYGCVNCRQMEAAVWTDASVHDYLMNDYVLISLYVDDKQSLPEPVFKNKGGEQVKLRTVGDKWSFLAETKFGATAQPFYVVIDNDGHPLQGSYSFNTNPREFATYLRNGLKAYKEKKSAASAE